MMKPQDITRRTFVAGIGGIAAATALSSCTGGSAASAASARGTAGTQAAAPVSQTPLVSADDATAASAEMLDVSTDQVFTTEDCEYLDTTDDFVELMHTVSLPYGTLIYHSDAELAACLVPTQDSSPLCQIALLYPQDGRWQAVLDAPVTSGRDFQILDARAGTGGIAWLEANVLTRQWRLYHAALANEESGANSTATSTGNVSSAVSQEVAESAIEIASGSMDATMLPQIAVSGSYTFWQIEPAANAAASASSAAQVPTTHTLWRAPFGAGASAAELVFESSHAFPCAPAASGEGLCIAARAMDATQERTGSGAYYQLFYLDADTAQVEDSLILPESIRPEEIGYGSTGFNFAFSSIYGGSGGISNLGTYTPAHVTSSAGGGLSDATWFRYPRTPVCAPASVAGWLAVKSSNVVAVVDVSHRRYFSVSATTSGDGVGEFLCTSGISDIMVTCTNLDYTPLGGTPVNECRARVWRFLQSP